MKRITFLAILFCLLGSFGELAAQEPSFQYPFPTETKPTFRFSARAGLAISKIGGNPSGKTKKYGYQVAGLMDIRLTQKRDMFIESGIMFTTKGLKPKYKKNMGDIDVNAMYLQIPLNFHYDIPLAYGLAIILKTGPYVAMGVGGKTKFYVPGDKDKKEMDTFGKDGALNKRLDAGWNWTVGLKTGYNISFQVSVEQGFVNVIDRHNKKVRSSFIGFGYHF